MEGVPIAKTRVVQGLGNRATVGVRTVHHLGVVIRAELATAKEAEAVAADSEAVDEGGAMNEVAEEVEEEVLPGVVSTTKA